MRKLLPAVLVTVVTAVAAHAGAQRTFVSSTGVDTNPCSRTAPCRSFGSAIAALNAGGEVIVLDSGGYGAFTVDKSLAVIAPAGVYAGITATSSDGVTLPGPGSASVTLKGLTIVGLGSANGIHFGAPGILSSTLTLIDCSISGFSGGNSALYVDSWATSATLDVSGSIFRENSWGIYSDGGSAHVNIVASSFLNNSSGAIRLDPNINMGSTAVLTVDRVRVDGLQGASGTDGIYLRDHTYATILRSSITNNVQYGILVTGQSQATISDTAVSNSTSAIRAEGTATVQVSNCIITDSGFGLENYNNTATFVTYGDNVFRHNNTNLSNVTSASKQ